MAKAKVIVGLSGGVDSSVAALLLKQQGYEVIGLFMKNWQADDTDEYCSSAQDAKDAQAICDKLAMPYYAVNFSQQYWNKVFEHFLAEYHAGRTPNPDVLCNKEIKFKAFLEYALNELNADLIATGHYVRRSFSTPVQLLTAKDDTKDQSYFLYLLNQEQLAYSLFPIGELKKSYVRQIAKDHNFPNYAKKDSTGICFIGERKFKTFLQEYLPAKPGKMITVDGEVIGKHDGLMYYTIGQRQGLGIGGTKIGDGAWYVVDKDLKNNILKVAQGENHPLLFTRDLYCEMVHWISETAPDFSKPYFAKIRYRQTCVKCKMTPQGSGLKVEFDLPQRAITPGQSIVFYQGEICLGGGIIQGNFRV